MSGTDRFSPLHGFAKCTEAPPSQHTICHTIGQALIVSEVCIGLLRGAGARVSRPFPLGEARGEGGPPA